ncbi:hypothetical protein THAOC_28418 [Thalassiosira oceanica]|uniref:Uncharacterized protein n=1 Tax=Thalassiosira oceanica TaxID=159749 RepID=K0S0C3_THAOC|nr:hypothetical protein THAOC_28418 [Thalassiosira oceanica]|eukprot:EJK52322.1 hypothetical protein THAOC_28418 [Thalassiosira oceanica]
MDPLLAYTLAPMHLSAFDVPRSSGETTWETTASSTSTATPCFCAEISGVLSRLANLKTSRFMVPWTHCWPIHLLPCICLPLIYLGAVEKQPGRQRPPQLPPQHPVFCAEISGFEPPGKPQNQQVYGAMDPLLAYTLAPMHLSAFDIPRGRAVEKQPGRQRPPRIITAYRPKEPSKVRRRGIDFEKGGTVWEQQWRYFKGKGYDDRNPLLHYDRDLSALLKDWRRAGDEIILASTQTRLSTRANFFAN